MSAENASGWSVYLAPGHTVITGDRDGLRGLRYLIDVAIEKGEACAPPPKAEDSTMTVRCMEQWDSRDV